ncbi:MAG: PHB depolymerase family esterase [Paracoccaceae bacterium]
MRAILLIWALALLALGVPGTAQAECARVAKDLCATKNGHYRIRTPKGLGPFPTVLYLYGSMGQTRDLISYDAFVQTMTSRGYAVIVPAALDLRYADGLDSGWHLRNERGKKPRDEVAFVAEVLRDAEQSFVINRREVLMVGMSRGGFLTWEIACHNPDLAKAYAPVAGSYHGRMPERCKAPVRIIHTHGTADKIVPFRAGTVWTSGGAQAQKVDTALQRMATTGGCAPKATPVLYQGYQRTSWADCKNGGSGDLLVHNGGHTIPRNWYTTVLDWFEQDTPRRSPNVQEEVGGTAVFKGAGNRGAIGTRAPEAGTRVFRGSGQNSSGGRFKKVPGTQ